MQQASAIGLIMQQAVSPHKADGKFTESTFASGLSSCAPTRQRAGQLSSPVSEAASIKAKYITASKDFLTTRIIHKGVHHAKK